MNNLNSKILIINSGKVDNGQVKYLSEATTKTLCERHGLPSSNIFHYEVTRIMEFPFTAHHLINMAQQERYPFFAVICIGYHFNCDTLYTTISQQLIHISLETKTPIINGIFFPDNSLKDFQHGGGLAEIALEMIELYSIKSNLNNNK